MVNTMDTIVASGYPLGTKFLQVFVMKTDEHVLDSLWKF